jgi:two-component system OmpR family sensor kinase
MSPVREDSLPLELQPLAASLNALLARLDGALAAQRRFTADAAHELRTPLAALALQVEHAERAADAAGRAAAMADLKSGVARASRLVEQLLTMARLEPTCPDFSRVDFALANDIARPRSPERGASISVAGGGSRLRRSGEPRDADRQLLDNALRYTPEGGRVDVAVADDAGRAILSVIDTGPGIPIAARERVFERFHREIPPDDETHAAGGGLGLSIVRRIAEAHGATISLGDGPDGKGLAVRVRFPKVDAP